MTELAVQLQLPTDLVYDFTGFGDEDPLIDTIEAFNRHKDKLKHFITETHKGTTARFAVYTELKKICETQEDFLSLMDRIEKAEGLSEKSTTLLADILLKMTYLAKTNAERVVIAKKFKDDKYINCKERTTAFNYMYNEKLSE